MPVNAGLWPPPPAACGVDRHLSPRTLAAKSSAAKFVPVLAPPPDKRGFRPPSTVDENGGSKTEGFNTAGDRADLLPRVLSRIVRIRSDGVDRQIRDHRPRGRMGPLTDAVGWLSFWR